MFCANLQKESILIAVLTLGVLASRLPLLTPGYGPDPDGWSIILAAQQTAQTGQYHASRFPCYPVPELFYVLINQAGPFVCNLVTAALSSAAFLFFVLILRYFKCQDAFLGGLALAFTPIIYVNSINTMDYVWALCFMLVSMYCVLCRRPLMAGVMLGLAIGSRITSGAMLLPLLIMWPASEQRMPWKSMLIFVLTSMAAAALAYLPVFLTYGLNFFSYYEYGGYPDLGAIWKKATVGVWGPIGANSLLIALVAGIILHTKTSIPAMSGDVRVLTGWITAVALYCLAFLRLPSEPGYLIPVVPFVILLFARLTNRRVFQFLCVALIASSFITIYRSWIHFNGPLFVDRLYRINFDQRADKILDQTKNYPPKSVIVAGALQPMILLKANAASAKVPQYAYLLDEKHVKRYLADGYTIYYLAGEREANRALYGIDLDAYGAFLIDLDFPSLR